MGSECSPLRPEQTLSEMPSRKIFSSTQPRETTPPSKTGLPLVTVSSVRVLEAVVVQIPIHGIVTVTF